MLICNYEGELQFSVHKFEFNEFVHHRRLQVLARTMTDHAIDSTPRLLNISSNAAAAHTATVLLGM